MHPVHQEAHSYIVDRSLNKLRGQLPYGDGALSMWSWEYVSIAINDAVRSAVEYMEGRDASST